MNSETFPKTTLRLIRALALIALVCSGYLLYQKISGSYDKCCGHVLDTQWASWLGIPVSALACALYLAIFISSIPTASGARQLPFSIALRSGAVLAGGAALWFFYVLIFIEKTSCPYCIATHFCGLGIAIAVLSIRRSLPAAHPAAYVAAGAALVALVGIQLINRSEPGLEMSGNGSPSTAPANPAGDAAIPFTDQISLRPGQFPMIGPAEPKHYVAEIFDYTCKSCRELHGDLEALKKAHPDTFTIIYVPAPLHRRCNMFLPDSVPDHQHACELAKVALAVWNSEPSKFPEIHQYLMTTPLPILPGDAEAKAISLVGEDAYRKGHSSPATAGAQTAAFGHYASTVAAGNIKMPKLLVGQNQMLQGLARDTQSFVSLMAKHFGLE